MKAFNLKEYLKNPEKKVITGDGRGVRICCTDKRGGDCPIVALVENPTIKTENILTYGEDGRWIPVGGPLVDSNLDLFFAPEKHEGWINVYVGPITGVVVYKSEEDAKHGANADAKIIATIKIEWEE